MRRILISFTFFMGLLSLSASAFAGWGWLIYHEGSFKGRVIDAETGKPIEGAVVVAKYHSNVLGPTGSHTTLIDVQEAVTDGKGDFYMPSLTTVIQPLSIAYKTFFLIWKPGYKPVDVTDSSLFTREIGSIENREVWTPKGIAVRPMKMGIVELEKVKTRLERLNSLTDANIDIWDLSESKVSKLKEMLKKEDELLQPLYRLDRKKLGIPISEIPK